MVTLRPMVEEDIPAALALWQGLPGIGLREADSPEALSRYLRRNPGCSFVAASDANELVGVSLAGHDGRRGYLHHVAGSHAARLVDDEKAVHTRSARRAYAAPFAKVMRSGCRP